MNDRYQVEDAQSLLSPSLLLFKDHIRNNIRVAVSIAGGPDKLRPHVKTHKTKEITQLELEAGITKHKCATIAEAEMLAQCGTPDVLLAYPILGPNVSRLIYLMRNYPNTHFSALVDHPRPARELSAAMVVAGVSLDVYMDVNVGQNRTGIVPGPDALSLYRDLCQLPGLNPVGFHLYDGHNHQDGYTDRDTAVHALLEPILHMRKELESSGCPVPKLIGGGTPTFPVWAKLNLPGLECSPGTFVLHDAGYGSKYADMSSLIPAAVLLTRVVSKPLPDRLTFDLGNKAVAADPPLAKRAFLLGIPEFTIVAHNEEHLVIETPQASQYEPGDIVMALPGHVCPTCALHREAYVIEGGRMVGTWLIASRDRVLSV